MTDMTVEQKVDAVVRLQKATLAFLRPLGVCFGYRGPEPDLELHLTQDQFFEAYSTYIKEDFSKTYDCCFVTVEGVKVFCLTPKEDK